MYKFLFTILILGLFNVSVQAQSKTTYRVGVYDNKPIIFKDASGDLQGLSIDVLNSVSDAENIEFDYVHGAWKDVFGMLEQGKLDLLVGIAYSEERAKKFNYIEEAVINNWGVVYRNPNVSISSLEDLKGKRIAMLSRSIHSKVFNEIMDQFQFDYITVPVPTYLEGLKAADEGRADAVIINRVISLLNSKDFEAVETGIIFNPVEVRMAAPQGKNEELLNLIDTHLRAQKNDKNSEYHQSLARWYGNTSNQAFPRWLAYSLGIIIIALLITLFILKIVRQQVRIKTSELSESEARFRQLAENINEVFWIGSTDWKQIFYISPMYEKIWGDKPESLYRSPKKWIDFVHPEDRDMVIADLKRKASGDLSDPAFPQYRIIAGDGKTRWISARAYPVLDSNGNATRIAGVAEDITNRKDVEDQIRFMALHDPLTRLNNRYAFEKYFTELLSRRPTQEKSCALLYIDLDQFKIVNDTCGHIAGDQMLIKLGNTLKSYVGDRGIIARLGGDEFGVILHDNSLETARSFSEGLLNVITNFRFNWQEKRFTIGASIGLVMIEDDSYSDFELLSAADMACYAAKDSGRNRIHIFEHNDDEMLQRRGEMQFVERIKEALEENRFVLHRQVISPLQTNDTPVTYEYLIRLLDENGELLYPGAFLPAAERYELMVMLDRWVVSNVFEYLNLSNDNQLKNTQMPIAFINLSGQAFTDPAFAQFILDTAAQYNIRQELVCFEITETSAISNLNMARDFINHLTKAGFKFALDDFGTGMSSFSYLRTLDVDYLKIDGIFCKELDTDNINSAIIKAITEVGHKTQLGVIAEWIESDSTRQQLAGLGVDYGQGYALGRPEPLRTLDT
ncbi:MAG: EAL domain-containing protein [Gammaproteobacteria bacterium]|nr:EAL domain-containing protein [Gammaproteobacteria bacterium]